ncbi:MAG TPA: CoA pyrophosphatase [Candidatus Dormibacteraeota bacterium]|nr:CoA pyrophosphatase [Candidatus Dormibacteraeota bacterium]
MDLIKPPAESAVEQLRGRLAQRRPRRLDAPAPLLRAAVLVPLLRTGERLEVLFTRRTDTVLTHKGQISFPGGQQEKSDRSSIETALRESHEEIGLDPSLVSVLGELDDMFTSVSGYVVTPVLGLISEPTPELRLAPAEVRSVFTVSIDRLLDDSVHRTETRQLDGQLLQVHFFTVGEDVIWGATGLMLYQFLQAWQGGPEDVSRSHS